MSGRAARAAVRAVLRTISVAALLAAVSTMITAEAGAQSIFGMNYIGEAVPMGSARHQALGYSAIAVEDTSNSVTSNPASTADLTMVTLTVHQVLSASRVYYLELVSRQTRYQVPTFTVSVPFRKGLVLTTGYRSRYVGRADFAYTRQIEDSPTLIENYKLDSSLYMIPVIAAWKPVDQVRVAGELQFNLGSIIDKTNVWFDDANYLNADAKRRRSYSGISWGASLLWKVHDRLWVGCNLDGPVDYDVEQVVENTVSELDTTTTFDYTLPLAFDAGLALNPFGRWWVSASYWRRSASDPTGFEQLEGSVGDETRIGAGVERRASREGHILSRIPIRVGFYTDTRHYQFPTGQDVDSYFLTAGSSIPVGSSGGAIDYTLEFGRTGSKDRNQIEENIFRLGVSFSVSEPWSKRKTEKH
jgi:hypothetical protein